MQRTSARLALSAVLVLHGAVGSAAAERPRIHAITGARILAAPGRTIDNGTLVMRDGLIEALGEDVEAPPDAAVIDGTGKIVHAGFIDACSAFGRAEPEERTGSRPASGAAARSPDPEPGAVHPISRIRPERRALDRLARDDAAATRHRELGFTAALVAPEQGIFRGTSVLVTLGEGPVSGRVILSDAAQHVAFEHGSFRQPYPTSLMGAIAAIRQGFADAARHALWSRRYGNDPSGMKRPDEASAWAPLSRAAEGAMPVVFEVATPADALRALALAGEHGLKAMVTGSGREHEIARQLAASGTPVLLSLELPEKPDLDEAGAALEVETEDLRRFLEARSNASLLSRAGVVFALGTCGMKLEKKPRFAANLRAVVDAGLDPETALAALTTVPAKLLGVDRAMGDLQPGKAAHVVVRQGDPFTGESTVASVFVDGVEYFPEPKPEKEEGEAKPGRPRSGSSAPLDRLERGEGGGR